MSELKALQRKAAQSAVATEVREFLKLAIPLATAQIAQFAVSFVDTIMMGQLSTAALAAGGLASSTLQMLLTIATGFVMSVGVLSAEAYGANEKDKLVGLARQGLWLCLLMTLPFVVLLWSMAPTMRMLGQTATVTSLAQQYFRWISLGVLPALGFAMLRGYVSAFSLANVVTGIVMVGTVFNIGCNYVLGFGKLGFPRMELAGFALGSALSFWLMFGLFVIYILRQPALKRYRFWRGWKHPNLRILRQLIGVGAPIATTYLLELGLFLSVAYMAGSLGTDVLAAHQISFQVMALIFMVPIGMSLAVTARVGLWFGRGDRAGMRRAGLVAIAAAIAFLFLSAITLYLFRYPAIRLFVNVSDAGNARVVMLAMNLLLVAASAQVLDGIQRVAMSALYGLQDTKAPMILAAAAFWGIGISAGYILCFPCGFGVVGLWVGQYIGTTAGGIAFVWRFHQLTKPPR